MDFNSIASCRTGRVVQQLQLSLNSVSTSQVLQHVTASQNVKAWSWKVGKDPEDSHPEE